jgi:hypothetical protein
MTGLIAVGLLVSVASVTDAEGREKVRHKLKAEGEEDSREEREPDRPNPPPKVKPKRGERKHILTSRALRAVKEKPPEGTRDDIAEPEGRPKPPKVKPPRHSRERALQRLQELPGFEQDLESFEERGAPVDKLFPDKVKGKKKGNSS